MIGELLARVSPDLSADDKKKLKGIIYDKMYENFVKEIDGIDNGVEISETKAYSIKTNLSVRVGSLNPDWNSKGLFKFRSCFMNL